MIGQLGILWLLLSAPIVAIAADLIRYIHGRLSEPPLPAGVLPRSEGQPATAATAVPAARPAPSVYQPATAPPPLSRGRFARRTGTAAGPADDLTGGMITHGR